MKNLIRVFVLILLAASVAAAGSVSVVFKDENGLAIKGYDAVAYFTQGKPVAGKSEFHTEWMGARWLFSSAENRDLFAKEPQKYAPQFGGYCAYGVSQNHLVSIDPSAWKIVDGKLYLNYSKEVQAKWFQDIPGFIEKATKIWPSLIQDAM